MLQNDPDYTYLRNFLSESLQNWQTEQDVAARRQVLERALEVAANAVQAGEHDLARDVLTATIRLYEQDNSVSAEIGRCHDLMRQLPEPPLTKPSQATPEAEQ